MGRPVSSASIARRLSPEGLRVLEHSAREQHVQALEAGATDVVLSPLDRSDNADRESLWAVAASL